MKNVITWLNGKKTYVVAIIAGISAAATALGHPIPEWAWALLGSFGLVSLRAAVEKSGPDKAP